MFMSHIVCCLLYVYFALLQCMLFSVFISVFLYIFQVRHKYKILYLHTVSNVKMKILWFEWLIISLLKLLNRN